MRISDWSSDVCSSDLSLAIRPGNTITGCASPRGTLRSSHERAAANADHSKNARPSSANSNGEGGRIDGNGELMDRSCRVKPEQRGKYHAAKHPDCELDRKSVVKGKSVAVRADLGGRRIIKKKKK